MIKSIVYTCFWLTIVYLIERPILKKHRLTHYTALVLLLASGMLWVVFVTNKNLPHPSQWFYKFLSPFVPVQ